MHPPARHIDAGCHARCSRELVSLRRLLPTASFVGCADIHVTGIAERAEDCRPGTLFVPRFAGAGEMETHAAEAIRNGAKALLAARPIPGLPVSQCVVPGLDRAYGHLCDSLAGHPMRRIRTIGIAGDGVNGDVAGLIHKLLLRAGRRCGRLNTANNADRGETGKDIEFTPDPRSFWDALARWNRDGQEFAIVELSEACLNSHWITHPDLEVAGIAPDALDGGTIDDWTDHRLSRIKDVVRPGGTVLVHEDSQAEGPSRIGRSGPVEVITFGADSAADVAAIRLRDGDDQTRWNIRLGGNRWELTRPRIGHEEMPHYLMAAAALVALDMAPESIMNGLESLSAPGALHAAC